MRSWNIIGWLILGAAALTIAWVILGRAVGVSVFYWHHVKTRNIAPSAGQVWMQDAAHAMRMHNASKLSITRLADNGRIVMKSGNASWSDSPEEWQRRVRTRRLILLVDPTRKL